MLRSGIASDVALRPGAYVRGFSACSTEVLPVERRGAPFWGGVQARASVAFTLKLLMTIQG